MVQMAKGTVKIGPAIDAKLYRERVAVAKKNGQSRDRACVLGASAFLQPQDYSLLTKLGKTCGSGLRIEMQHPSDVGEAPITGPQQHP
jgi:hypothetical protein